MKQIVKNGIVYQTYNSKTLPPEIYRKIYSLNFREHGMMQDGLKHKDYIHIIIATFLDVVVGWAAIRPIKKYSGNFLETHFYVRQCFRRKGIGTKMAKMVNQFKRKNKKLVFEVHTHDQRSINFLSKFSKEISKRKVEVN